MKKLLAAAAIATAALLEPAFERYGGVNGRLSIQTDPRFYRDTAALIAEDVATGKRTVADRASCPARVQTTLVCTISATSRTYRQSDRICRPAHGSS